MNGDQWRLWRFYGRSWMGLVFIDDFHDARKRAVSSLRGGTYADGWFTTTAKGIDAYDRTAGQAVDLPWDAVRDWSKSLSDDDRAEARRLLALDRALNDEHPTARASWGRPYAWDRKDSTEAEREADRARLAAEEAAWHENEYLPWLGASIYLSEQIETFLDGLAPVQQLDLFGGVA